MENIKTLLFVRNLIFLFLSFNFSLYCFSQGGGAAINSTGAPADNSAMLDISSTNQGMRIPRVALTNTTSSAPITNPANSLLVYDSVSAGDVTPGFYYWDNTKWIRLATGSGSGWSTSGNAGTDTATNFIGTTDDRSWVMKTNNSERMKISKSGNVGIGTSNPASSAILDVSSNTKGQLIPRMTAAQRDLISSPATGLQIFNIDCNVNEYYTGSCWVSMGKSLKAPGDITSSPDSTEFCAGKIRTYSILPISGATRYIWTVPAGARITTGLGTTSISVTFGNTSGNVCVSAENSCETSSARCIDIKVNPAPIAPGNITGPISAVPGQSASASYFISAVTGANTYNWTVPTGFSIISGAGTSTIVLKYLCNAISGNVSVTAQGPCGTSTPTILAVTVSPVITANAGAPVFGGVAIGGSPAASGGTGSFTYLWNPATDLSGSAVANPTALCSGLTTTYTLTVTDANSCTATSS
ncbi:MAG: hypothetical protein HGB12_13860, partial [Bacteroidetes bacterium]|nr:hypothetical protein [Bacteroidota bacterium]